MLRELLESGKMRSVVDRRYELADVVEALDYLGEGHARGKVIVTFRADTDESARSAP